MPKFLSGTWSQQIQKAAALTLPPASAQLLHLPYQYCQGVSTHPGHLFLCEVCRRSRHQVTSPGSVTGVQLTSPYASSIWDIGQWLPGSRCQEDSSSPDAWCRHPQASWPGQAADLAVFPPADGSCAGKGGPQQCWAGFPVWRQSSVGSSCLRASQVGTGLLALPFPASLWKSWSSPCPLATGVGGQESLTPDSLG